MLQDFFKFRDEMNIDRIRKERVPEGLLETQYARGTYYTTKEGYPVMYEIVGKSKIKELLENYTDQRIKDYYT